MEGVRKRLRICVDARLRGGDLGGIEQVVVGLAHGLSKLSDGDEEYIFLSYKDGAEWLEPYVRGPCRIITVTDKQGNEWKQRLMRVKHIRDLLHRYGHLLGSGAVDVGPSDGTIERLGVNLVHFTRQKAFCTQIPSIYHPHDLQHLHLPQYFSKLEIKNRNARCRTYCRQAAMVAVASSWTRRDVIQHYRLSEDNVKVIPFAPPVEAYPIPSRPVMQEVRTRFQLPEAFVFYPAQTWPHKNHIGLLEALYYLRKQQGLRVPLVCSGKCNEFFAVILEKTRELGIDDQVRFLGFVSPLELQALYRLCRAVVVPSCFEAASFPVWEAFQAGAPVACSNVTSLPDQAGDGALLFGPQQTSEMANAIERLWNDESLRLRLTENAGKRVRQFTWLRTARLFRAHYRRLTKSRLTDEDRALIVAPPGI